MKPLNKQAVKGLEKVGDFLTSTSLEKTAHWRRKSLSPEVKGLFHFGRKVGQKEVFLPNFTLTFIRTPNQPPTFASFWVPLNLNKLDLRDYLHNAYGVRALSVRSFIQLQKMRQDKPGAKRPTPRRWYRPRSLKKMTIEMEEPFVWPEAPTDFEPWEKETFDAASKEREEMNDSMRPGASRIPSKERGVIREQARKVLESGDWKMGLRTQWENVGEEVEVEQDVQLPAIEKPQQ